MKESIIYDCLKAFFSALPTPLAILWIAKNITDKSAQQNYDAQYSRYKQESFKDYIKQMTSLLIDKELSQQPHDTSIVQAAQALTLSVISELDAKQNRQLVKFLKNAKLIQYDSSNPNNTSPALLRGADFSNCDLDELDFSEADLRDCNFSNAKLRKTNFRVSNIENTNFDGADLSASILDRVICNSQTNFQNTIFDNVHLLYIAELLRIRNSSLNRANLAYINNITIEQDELSNNSPEQKSITQVSFRGSKLEKVDFSHYHMEKVEFDDQTILTNSNISSSRLYKVIFNGVDLANTDFHNSSFDCVDFRNSNLCGSSFKNSKFIQFTQFDNADIAKADFRGVENLDLDQLRLARNFDQAII